MARQTSPITAPRHESSRLRSKLLAAALGLGILGIASGPARSFEPSVNYMLHCMGCHTPDGGGEPGRVPSVRNTLVPFAGNPDGRRFLVQVPGSAQSRLSDAELAGVLNWMIANLSAAPQPFREFTADEVASYRRTRLVEVGPARARLVALIGGMP